MKDPLLVVTIDGEGVRGVDYFNYLTGNRMMVFRYGSNSQEFVAIRCKVNDPSPDFWGDDNPATWDQKQTLEYAKYIAETAFTANTKIRLVIHDKEVDFHEFKRNILNTELKDKIPVGELDTLKAAGGTIAKTVAEIDQSHCITIGQYKQLQEYDKKTGGKLHL